MHLTLRQLQYFVEIVDAGTMTEAAARLHVAPTALSLQVRAMEERLGVGLLQRHSRGVRPTPAGTELYRKGQQILEMVDETERLVAPAAVAGTRSLRLGVPPSVVHTIGVDAVLAGSRRSGGMVVQLAEGLSSELVTRLQEHDLDFVLAYDLVATSAMETLELLEERLVFVTSPDETRESGKVMLSEALAAKLLFFGERGMCWNAVHSAARASGLHVNVMHTVGSVDVIRHMIVRGLGSAILPYGVVEEESRRGELAVHQIEDHPILQRMSLAWLKDREHIEDAKRVIPFVMDVVASLHARAAPYSELLYQAPVRAAS